MSRLKIALPTALLLGGFLSVFLISSTPSFGKKEYTVQTKKPCAFCHKEKHKTVPKCQDCHGTPHPAGMMAKFGKCGDCHGIAHDINNFVDAPKVEGPKAVEPANKDAPKKGKKQ